MIIMPLNTFIAAFNSQKQLVDKLIENNLINNETEQIDK